MFVIWMEKFVLWFVWRVNSLLKPCFLNKSQKNEWMKRENLWLFSSQIKLRVSEINSVIKHIYLFLLLRLKNWLLWAWNLLHVSFINYNYITMLHAILICSPRIANNFIKIMYTYEQKRLPSNKHISNRVI